MKCEYLVSDNLCKLNLCRSPDNIPSKPIDHCCYVVKNCPCKNGEKVCSTARKHTPSCPYADEAPVEETLDILQLVKEMREDNANS